MTEKQAKQKGYSFTGSYERNRDEINERAEQYKKEGYKIIVCTVPDSPLSRGIKGTGYSIYAELKYFIDREVTELNRKLNQIDNRKQNALDEYNKKIIEIENEKSVMEERLKELIQKVQ